MTLLEEDFEDELAVRRLRAGELEAAGRWQAANTETMRCGHLLEALGRFGEAEQVVHPFAKSAPLPNKMAEALAQVTAARICARLGRTGESKRLLDSVQTHLVEAREAREHLFAEIAIARALALAVSGDLDQAEQIIDEALTGDSMSVAWVSRRGHRVKAEIARRRGNEELAARHDQLALQDTPDSGAPGRGRR